MPAFPWTPAGPLDPSREYLVLATRFTVTHRRHLPGVLRATQELWQGIGASTGLAGHTARADLVRGTLSTLSAWSDADSLRAFVRGAAHTAVVDATRHRMTASTFASWSELGAALPPVWATADRALADAAQQQGS
jgi:hypothetical protein